MPKCAVKLRDQFNKSDVIYASWSFNKYKDRSKKIFVNNSFTNKKGLFEVVRKINGEVILKNPN